MPLRLKSIKLAGFKSFVDPTEISIASNLTSIVGPNGCGKSNVIDAIRWVMGESSAKALRSGQIADVIFNGSAHRKPVGQASVELLLDNSDGSVGGEYAKFGEICIRRQLSRDGVSKYLLNGTACRRRDITDILLGTGIGPRSYAIIEQGMVSRLIEAKPEDLRAFLEEAAQISRYRERRRETEIRISHTRENLDRLSDVRDELERQLQHLARQAQAAERYTTYQTEETRLKAELLALQWKAFHLKESALAAKLSTGETGQAALDAQRQQIDTEIEKTRQALIEVTEKRDNAQRHFYQIAQEASQAEQDLQHRQARAKELTGDQSQERMSASQLENQLTADRAQESTLREAIAEIAPRFEEARGLADAAIASCQSAEKAFSDWQREMETLNNAAQVPTRQAEVYKTTLTHLEGQLRQGKDRLERLQVEREKLDIDTLETQQASLTLSLEEKTHQVSAQTVTLQACQEALGQLRERLETCTREREAVQQELQIAKGRQASLEALQQAALGQEEKTRVNWLAAEGLDTQPCLAQTLQVQPDWQSAVETVLGETLQAICLPGLSSPPRDFASLGAAVTLFSPKPLEASGTSMSLPSLSSKLQNPQAAGSLLDAIFVAESFDEALSHQPNLSSGCSIVTKEGLWLGPDWIRIAPEAASQDSVLAREEALKQLAIDLESFSARKEALDEQLIALKEDRAQQETEMKEKNQMRRELDQALASLKADAAATAARLDQQQKRFSQIQEEGQHIHAAMQMAQSDSASTRANLEKAVEEMARFLEEKGRVEPLREDLEAAVGRTRAEQREKTQLSHGIELKYQSYQKEQEALRLSIERAEAQYLKHQSRLEHLAEAIEENQAPIAAIESQLQNALTSKLDAEGSLTQATSEVTQADETLQTLQSQRTTVDTDLQEKRESMEQAKMDWQAVSVRQQGVEEQLGQTEFTAEALLKDIAEEATVKGWEEKIEKIERKLRRLEPINLAAIAEHATHTERKTYLDAQHQDLTEALTTLEEAIARIDKETRQRFKETFEEVNKNFSILFPRLFGGGRANLQLTENDYLESGVQVMAQPPGKRNSMIQQLSGGEKALVAVSLVFAIFQLNPAPFCLLDEVDAPLDDSNVSRLTELVREMSDKTQFVFITHNKITMALADYLMGVTMREPGVSRLVSVNVEEAAALAEA